MFVWGETSGFLLLFLKSRSAQVQPQLALVYPFEPASAPWVSVGCEKFPWWKIAVPSVAIQLTTFQFEVPHKYVDT